MKKLLTRMNDNPTLYALLQRAHGYFWLCVCIAFVTIFALSGCSAIPGYSQYRAAATGLLDQTIEDRQSFNDKRLDVSAAVICDNSIGAFARETDAQKKAAIAMLCGLAGQPALIVDNRTGNIAVNPVFLPAPPVTP